MKYLSLIIIVTLIFSCSKTLKAPQRVQINFITPSKKSFLNHKWGQSTPTVEAEVECVAVFVTYPETNADNICKDSSSIVKSTPDEMFGTATRGEELSAAILVGSGIRFQLLGFKKSSGSNCPALGYYDDSTLSPPILLGENTIDIDANTASVNLSGIVSTASTLSSCTGTLFNWLDTATSLWDSAVWDSHLWGP